MSLISVGRHKIGRILLISLVLIILLNLSILHKNELIKEEALLVGKGNVAALDRVYLDWKRAYQAQNGDLFLTIPLRDNKGLFFVRSKPESEIKINLISGEFTIIAKRLPAKGDYYLWLEGNLKSDETKTETKFLGQLTNVENEYRLISKLNSADMRKITLSRIFISSDKKQSTTSILLAGSPSLLVPAKVKTTAFRRSDLSMI